MLVWCSWRRVTRRLIICNEHISTNIYVLMMQMGAVVRGDPVRRLFRTNTGLFSWIVWPLDSKGPGIGLLFHIPGVCVWCMDVCVLGGCGAIHVGMDGTNVLIAEGFDCRVTFQYLNIDAQRHVDSNFPRLLTSTSTRARKHTHTHTHTFRITVDVR